MSSSSLVKMEVEVEVEAAFNCFVDALTDGRCSIRRDPGGVSRFACPAVYGR